MKRQKKRVPSEPAPPARKPPLGDAKTAQWLPGILLVAAIILAYQPAWHGGLLWDDDAHITQPELRSLDGLARIWTKLGATQQYYPLVHSAFWVEHKLWGDATTGYHWINILLHALAALLLVKILRQLQIPGAWLAGALFALHPVEVESVAWISELKNTLSGVFYLGGALAYLSFDRNRNGKNYALALGLFLLGLMSKTVIASLPAALLVIFWWQRGRLSGKRDVLPLVPFFIAGIGSGLLTAWVERKFIGAEGSEYHFSIIERFLIAGRAIWFYLGKLVWPVDLAFMYPRWRVSETAWWQYLFPAAVLLVLGVLTWRRWRGPLAAALFFAGTLFPALGFFNVYPFRYSFVADHFQYLASIGPLTLAAAGIALFLGKIKPFALPAFAAVLLLVLGLLTWNQCGMYSDAETLWRANLRVDPDSWMAHDSLGITLSHLGRTNEAIAHMQRARELKPDSEKAYNALGLVYFQTGRLDEAIDQYQAALAINPDYADAHNNLGLALAHEGRMEEALAEYKTALKLKPDFAEANLNLGQAFFQQNRWDEAISEYKKALAVKPNFAEAHYNLGNSLMQQGRTEEAIGQYQKALEIKPEYADAYFNLGLALFQRGRMDEAIAQYQKALKLKPAFAKAHMNLGVALFQQGRMDEGIGHFQRAVELEPDSAEARDNLRMALLKRAGASDGVPK